jgi:hypothetical protein
VCYKRGLTVRDSTSLANGVLMAKKKTTSKIQPSNGRTGKKVKAGKQASKAVSLQINRIIPPNLLGVCSNHFVVQHDGTEFHLLFFQTQPPIIIGETEAERDREIKQHQEHGVPSMCISRIIVAADRIPAIIKAMQTNLEKYQASRGMQSGTGE